MASYGTYAFLLANAPYPTPTGRERQIKYTGSMGGPNSNHGGKEPLQNFDGCVVGTGFLGNASFCAGGVWAPWDDPTGPPTVSFDADVSPGPPPVGAPGGPGVVRYGGVVYVQTLGSGTVVAEDAYSPAKNTFGRFDYEYDTDVTFEFRIDGVEMTVIEPGDPTEFVYVEGVPYPPFYGNAMPFGPPGLRRTFYEVCPEGGTVYVKGVVGGHAAEVTLTLPGGMVIPGYSPTYHFEGLDGNRNDAYHLTVEWNDGDGGDPNFPTQTYSHTSGTGGVATVVTAAGASGFSVNVSTTNIIGTDGCDFSSTTQWETTGTIGPPIARRYQAKATCAGQPHPGGLSLSCPSGSSPFSSGLATKDETIRFWGFQALVNGAYGPFSGSPDGFSPARMGVTGMSATGTTEDPELNDSDDRHDHRLDILGGWWPSGSLTHAGTKNVLAAGDGLWTGEASSSGSGILLDHDHTSASASLTFPKSNFEAYAKFRLPLTLTASGDRTATITLDGEGIARAFDVTIPHGTTLSDPIDTQIPKNVPGGFNVDRRSSRYPLKDQVGGSSAWGPLAAPMDEGAGDLSDVEGYDEDSDSVKGWLWGAANVTSVTISCPLESGETLLVGALDLVKSQSTTTLANGFTAGPTGYDGMKRLGYERATSGGSEVANANGDTHAVLKVDGRWLDLPSTWRRVPAVGGPGMVFTDLREFGLLWNAFQGLTWTEGGSSAPYLDNSAFGLYLQGVGGRAEYATDGTATFLSAFEQPVGSMIAQEEIAEVVDYPGMGCPWRVDGEYGFRTVFGGYKDLRAWAEGHVYDPDTHAPSPGVAVTTSESAGGGSTGSDTTDAAGHYRTKTPWWRAEKDHSISTPSYTDDPRKAFNRRRVRASFLVVRGASGKILAFLSRADGRLFRVVDKSGTAWLGTASAPTYSTWDDRDLGLPAEEASLQRGKDDRALVGLIHDGELTVYIDASEGRQAPVLSMDYGPATSHDIATYGDGTHVCARIDGGTVKLQVHNDRDMAQIAGPYTTNVTGLPDDATLRVDDSRKKGNVKSLLILVSSGGDTVAYETVDLQLLTP